MWDDNASTSEQRFSGARVVSTPAEEAYFLGIPVAHVASYYDHLRQRRLEKAAASAMQTRRRRAAFAYSYARLCGSKCG